MPSPLVFHVFIAVAITVYLVAIMVCGRHGVDPSLLSFVHYTSDGIIGSSLYKEIVISDHNCVKMSIAVFIALTRGTALL